MKKTERKRFAGRLYMLAAIAAALAFLGSCGKEAPQNTPAAYTEERTATPEEQAFIRELFAEAAKDADLETTMSGSVDFDLKMSLLGRIRRFGFSCVLQSERQDNLEHTVTELTTRTESEQHTEKGESYGRKDDEELYTVYSRKDSGRWTHEERTSFGIFQMNGLILTAIPETCTFKEEDGKWVVSGLVNADDIMSALEEAAPGNNMPAADTETDEEELGEILKAKVTVRFDKKTGALTSYIVDLREPLLAFSDKLMLEEAAGVTNPVLARLLRSFFHIDLSACRICIDEIRRDPEVRVSIPKEAM